VYMQMSCANGCVVALDWYLPRTFFRSGESGASVLMHALCLFDLGGGGGGGGMGAQGGGGGGVGVVGC